MSQDNKVKGAVDAITEKLDYNKDGKVDIQDIIMLAIKTPGVRVDRDAFLRKELSNKFPAEVVEVAITRTPALAGIPSGEIDKIANDIINFERTCVTGISAALGAPGGVAMVATVPADIIQYYGFTLRAIQKLLYLYGFPELKIGDDGLELDTHTINEIILCLGIMNGVAGANNAVKGMAKALAVGVEKKLLNAALTKGTIYPFIKQVMKWFGVSLTKSIFAKTVKNAIPVIGGVVGGGITFAAFKPCCNRLKDALKDTKLSNLNHIETKEENEIYQDIIDADFDIEPNEESEESVERKSERLGKYFVRRTNTGIKFDLKASNGEVIATSEVYKSKTACMNGISSVQRNAPIASCEDQTVESPEKIKNPKFEIYLDKAGEYRFRLKAKNGQIIAVSEGYKTKNSCLNGIESVRNNATTEIIEEE